MEVRTYILVSYICSLYILMYIHTHTHIYICLFIYIYKHVCVCIYVCAYKIKISVIDSCSASHSPSPSLSNFCNSQSVSVRSHCGALRTLTTARSTAIREDASPEQECKPQESGLGCWVWGLKFRVLGLGFRVLGLGFGVWGLGFMAVQGFRCRAYVQISTGSSF